LSGAFGEAAIEGEKELVEYKTGQDSGKWVALWEAFMLKEEVGGSVGCGEVAMVCFDIH
jgi:hypothetical protein